MIYARWQNKRISLKKMQQHRSVNWRTGIGPDWENPFSGICATQDVGYLWVLVDKTRYNHNIKDNRMGEIVVFKGEDTGERCMDGEPIVKPIKILARFDGYAFWYDGKGNGGKGVFQEVKNLLEK
jgi:hypothetical protein